MDNHLEENWLDARLREEALYIDDAGFTAGVVRKLPPPRPRRSLRSGILLCVTVLASIVTYFVSDGGRFLIGAVNRLAVMPLLFICAVAVCCALLMAGIAAAAAVSKAREQSLG
jgi:hypothetical protein